MTKTSRFSDRSSAGIILAAGETDADRTAAFLAAFEIDADAQRVFIDKAGDPLALSAAWTEGLDRYAAVELGRAGRAIAEPAEIRLVWKTGADDRPLVTRRYIAEIDGIDIAVDVSRAGWRFATSQSAGFDLGALRSGDLLWAAA